jgi:ribosomal protein L12E/L44/L45/RPP1/RPP2
MGEESKVKKFMSALSNVNLRSLIKDINDKGIKKEDIVSFFNNDGVYFLIYYKTVWES